MSERAAGTPGIEFRGVWKKFRRGEVHDSLRDLVPAVGRRLLGRARPAPGDLTERDFWALRDVSFSVEPGQALGIIGANGAGKSTVLKTVTKILRPTLGSCEVRGRAGALIEVAAGFHPDLSGRENVFLQGAIMGMRKTEITRKFDEIVEFAEVADFIDTPVKRYSSGMNARLGFAIAAHLDPDVLIIDEVLAVGDMRFQQKAFARLSGMVRSGIPVVVSHQLDRVVSLCTHGLLLQRGTVAAQGTPSECVAAFVSENHADEGVADFSGEPFALDAIRVEEGVSVRSGDRRTVVITGRASRRDPTDDTQAIAIRVRAAHNGMFVFSTNTYISHVDLPASGDFELYLDLQFNVPAGVYTVETYTWDGTRQDPRLAGPVAHVQVLPGASFTGDAQMNPIFEVRQGAATAGPGALSLVSAPR